ncbi:hypothetical protein [Myroides fluvii]|uniref:hypothetical protein n=1 Tax=Myroides fluvii TaxID=2572594 RepID=UPI00131C7BC3|nr:hypothetical protein [Myroides fluvii]
MKRGIIIVLLSFSLFSCKNKEVAKIVQVENQEQEQKKLHWWELPQKDKESESAEIIEMKTKENQEKIGKLWKAFDRLEKKAFTEDYLTLEEINLTNDLYYQMLKKQGFQFPSEEVFNQRIKEVFDVDIHADHSTNPRIKHVGDYLILLTKVYPSKYYKQVPTLDFVSEGYIFDMKRRFWTDIGTINGRSSVESDTYGEEYYVYYNNTYALAFNDFIFYNSKAGFVKLNKGLINQFEKDLGYEKFPEEYDYYYKDILKDKMKEYNEMSELTRKGWDYRMFDRLFFSRGFDGKLIVKKKMLAAAVELAKEDEDYIRVPLDYYFIQMTTDYIPNEYAADESEVDNYMKQREPYYTPEERAMIWVYTALLELNVSEKYASTIPYDFIILADQYPELYEVAKEHNFFGEDMSKVLEYL